MLSPEEKKERGRIASAKYNRSEKVLAKKRTPEFQQRKNEIQAKYAQTVKGKEALARAAHNNYTKPLTKLKRKLRSRWHIALEVARNSPQRMASSTADLGCTFAEFLSHIEAQWKPGMSWDNWGEVWELDHIKALGLFDLTLNEEQLKAVHYSNLSS